MDRLSEGELLLYSYHGRCGHRRQNYLPCATPGCRDHADMTGHGYENLVVKFGDEEHHVWRRLER